MSSYYEKFLATGEVKCIDEEIPFEIPQGWEWCRLCHVTEVARGGSPRPIKDYITESPSGINWIKIGDTEKGGKFIFSTRERIKPEGMSKSRFVHKGDFLLTNSMSFGRPYITQVEGCIHDGWLVISLIRNAYYQDFLYYLLSSNFAYAQFSSKVAGAVVQNLNSDKVANSLFPIPPKTEQERIVQKIESIFPKVYQYEELSNELASINIAIHSKLKKSILQEAIQGKLVPQIEEEGTAVELLADIRTEKERLVKEGKLKKSALNDSIILKDDDNKYYEKIGGKVVDITDEMPFEIPDTWAWARIGILFAHNNGKQLNKSNSSGRFMEYITTSNLYWDGFKLDNLKKMPFEKEEIERCQAIKGDLLVCEGGDVGRACIWEYDFPIMLQNHIHKLRAYYPLCTKYFYYIFYFYNKIGIIGGKGIGIQGFSAKALHNTLVPLPPLSEQKRICNRISELFSKIKA